MEYSALGSNLHIDHQNYWYLCCRDLIKDFRMFLISLGLRGGNVGAPSVSKIENLMWFVRFLKQFFQ